MPWGCKGYGNGNYGPNDPITREQMAAILYRYANFRGVDTTKREILDKSTDDDNISTYEVPAVIWAIGNKLIIGRKSDILAPRELTTRAEAAVILIRFYILTNTQASSAA